MIDPDKPQWVALVRDYSDDPMRGSEVHGPSYDRDELINDTKDFPCVVICKVEEENCEDEQ